MMSIQVHKFPLFVSLMGCLFLVLPLGAIDRQSATQSSQDTLEIYLDRAEMAGSEADWNTLANQGKQQALASWEKSTALWLGQVGDIGSERQDLGNVLSDEVQKRYRDWVIKGFFSQKSQNAATKLWSALRGNDLKYLFRTAADGSIARDAKGDPYLKGTDDFEIDKSAWMQDATTYRNQYLTDWDSMIAQALPELMGQAKPADQAVWQSDIQRIQAQLRQSHSNELFAMYQQGLQRFTNARLYDQYSLARKTDESNAYAMAQALIDEVRRGNDEDIGQLGQQLGLSALSVEATTAIDSSDWQASFKAIMDRGLGKWGAAEKRLLEARADWEKQTNANFETMSKAWASALERITTERAKWERELQKLLAEGQEAWADKKKQLADAISRASSELDREITNRTMAKSNQITSLVDLYTESLRAAQTAKESGEFWFKRFVDPGKTGAAKPYTWEKINEQARALINQLISRIAGKKALIDGHIDFLGGSTLDELSASEDEDYRILDTRAKVATFVGSLQSTSESRQAEIDQLTAIVGRLTNSALSAADLQTIAGLEPLVSNRWNEDYAEATWWLKQFEDTRLKIVTYRDSLEQSLTTIISDDGVAKPIMDILRASNDPETGYLDEYQVTLLRTQAEQAYWKRQVAIAQSVFDYASTESSKRPTEQTLLTSWDGAKVLFSAKQQDYEQAVARLEASGTELAAKKTAIETARTAMESARKDMEDLQAEYSAKQALYASDGGTYYKEQISRYHHELLQRYGLLPTKPQGSLADIQVRYRAALVDYGQDRSIEASSLLMKTLVLGVVDSVDTANSQPSLAELRDSFNNTPAISGSLAGLVSVPLPADSPYQASAAKLIAQYAAAEKEMVEPGAGAVHENNLSLLNGQYRALLAAESRRRRVALLNREAAIRVVAGLEATALDSIENLQAKLVQAKIAAVGDALALIADPASALKDKPAIRNLALNLSGSLKDAGLDAEKLKLGIDQLLAAGLADSWWTDLGRAKGRLSGFIAGLPDQGVRGMVMNLMNGNTGLSVAEQVDLADECVANELLALDQAQAAQSAGDRYRNTNPSQAASLAETARATIRSYLDGQGLLSATASSGAITVSIGSLDAKLQSWASSNTIEARVAELMTRLRQEASDLSLAEQDAVSGLIDKLVQHAALRAWNAGSTAGNAQLSSAAGLDTEEQAISQSLSDLQTQFRRYSAAISGASLETGVLPDQNRLNALGDAWQRDQNHPRVQVGLSVMLHQAFVDEAATQLAKKMALTMADPESMPDLAALKISLRDFMLDPAFGWQALESEICNKATDQLRTRAYLLDPKNRAAPDTASRELAIQVNLATCSRIPLDGIGVQNIDQAMKVWSWFNTDRTATDSCGLGGNYDARVDQDRITKFIKSIDPGNTDCLEIVNQFIRALELDAANPKAAMARLVSPNAGSYLASIRAIGPGSEVLERALAIRYAALAGSTPGKLERFTFLATVVGFRSFGAIDDGLLGSSDKGQQYQAAFSGFESATEQQATLSWYAKSLVMGGSTNGLSAIRARLDATHAAQLDAFTQVETARQAYSRLVDGDVQSYGQGLHPNATSSDLQRLDSAINSGSWDDSFFAADYLASHANSDQSNYFETRVNAGSYVLSALLGTFSQRLAEQNAAKSVVQAKRSFRHAMKQLGSELDGTLQNYRAYLSANLVSLDEGGGKPAATSAAVGASAIDVAVSGDTVGLAHAGAAVSSSTMLRDRLLESNNVLNRELLNLDATLRSPTSAQRTAWADAFSAKISQVGARFVGASPLSIWQDSDEYTVRSSVSMKWEALSNEKDKAEAEIAWYQSRIAEMGDALVDMGGEEVAQKAEIARVKGEVASKVGAYDAAATSYATSWTAYSNAATGYNAAYTAMQSAWTAKEDQKQVFEQLDATKAWALNTYLHAETNKGSANDPAKILQDKQTCLARVQGVMSTLKTIGDDLPQKDAKPATDRPVPLPDNQGYLTAESQVLACFAAVDFLASSIQQQIETTEQAHSNLSSVYTAITGGYDQNPALHGTYGKYLCIDDYSGFLRLEYNTNLILVEATSRQKDKVAAYVAAPDGYVEIVGAQLPGRTMVYDTMDLCTWLDSSAGQGKLETWALAIEYFLEKNGDSSVTKQSKIMEGALGYTDGSSPVADKNQYVKELNESIPGIISALRQEAWNSNIKNSSALELAYFNEFLAMQVTGRYRAASLLQNATKANVYRTFSTKQQALSNKQRKDADDQFALMGAMLLNGNFVGATAALIAGLTLDSYSKDISAWANANSSCATGFSSLVTAGKNQAGFDNYQTQLSLFRAEKVKLDLLKGVAANGSGLTRAEFDTALQTAGIKTSAIDTLVNRFFGEVADADKADSTSLLNAILHRSRTERDEQILVLQQSIEGKTRVSQDRQQDYRQAYDQYLASGSQADLAVLKTAATLAYRDPGMTDRAHAVFWADTYKPLVSAELSGSQGYERERQLLLGQQAQAMIQLYKDRMDHQKALRLDEWQRQQIDVAARQASWVQEVDALFASGRQAWDDGKASLIAAQSSWSDAFMADYASNVSQWNSNYDLFRIDRVVWVTQVAQNAGAAIDAVLLGKLDAAPDAAERQFLANQTTQVLANADSVDSLMRSILGNESLLGSRASLSRVNGRISDYDALIRKGVRADSSTIKALGQITRWQQTQNGDLAKHAARLLAARAQDSIAKAQKQAEEMVSIANENYDASMDQKFLGSGFKRAGGQYTRKAIAGTTLFETLYEDQTVATFNCFGIPNFGAQVKFSDELIAGLDADGIGALTNKAMDTIKSKLTETFGSEEENKAENQKKMTFYINSSVRHSGTNEADLADADLKASYSIYQDGGKLWNYDFGAAISTALAGGDCTSHLVENMEARYLIPGTWGSYLGYEPVFKAASDLNNLNVEAGYQASLLNAGVGEQSRLMGHYLYFQMREGAHTKELGKGFGKKNFWDKRKGPLGLSLSIEGTVDLVSDIVSCINPNVGLLIGECDAFTFGLIDMINNPENSLGVGIERGSEGVVRLGSWGMGKAMGKLNDSDTQGVINGGLGISGGKIASGLVSAIGSNIATSAIKSIYINKEGYLDYNFGGLINGAVGRQALAGYASIVTSNLTEGLIGSINLFDGNNNRLNNSYFNNGKVEALNRLGGSLAGMGTRAAITGEADLNIINLADVSNVIESFGGKGIKTTSMQKDSSGNLTPIQQTANAGLLELRLGKTGKVSMNFGTGGTNLSASAVLPALEGLKDATKLTDVKIKAMMGDKDDLTSLNAVNLASYTREGEDQKLGVRWWNGSLKINYGKDFEVSQEGQYDTLKNDTIEINAKRLGGNLNSSAELAAVLVHEGLHQSGDRIESHAYAAGASAYAQIVQSFSGSGVQANNNFWQNMVSGIYDPANSVANTGQFDNWLLKRDGTVAFDGKASLVDENGKILISYKDMGLKNDTQVEGGLSFLLTGKTDLKSQEAARNLMLSSGFAHTVNPKNLGDTSTWYWNQAGQVDLTGAGNLFANLDASKLNMGKSLDMKVMMSIFGNSANSTIYNAYYAGEIATIANGGYPSGGLTGRMWQAGMREKTNIEIKGLPDKITSNNPLISQLLKQNDSSFSDNTILTGYGCNFRVVQSYAEMIAGRALTSDEVKTLWDNNVGTAILSADGTVNQPELLASQTFNLLGKTNIGLSFGFDASQGSGQLIGFRIQMPYKTYSHYTAGDRWGNTIYNPGNTTNKTIGKVPVYAYPANY